MSFANNTAPSSSLLDGTSLIGMLSLLVATIGAGIFFIDGLDALLVAWQLPEYSHGPLIPVLSGLLFLRQLKEHPIDTGPKRGRWIGVTVLLGAVAFGTLGKLSGIDDLVAYSTIIWVFGILLVSFGWETGRQFWPPVVHLVYMLPLPGVLYFKLSTWLQAISSELGVWFLRLLSVPVFLEGNIIDLGVYKLHVAEACSGLRYLFPILSFSYIFAVLYRGPMWQKAVLLISAAPITVFMNSVRIAIAGYIVNMYGVEWVEGFTHFFEGWVIFISCIIILFVLARVMMLMTAQTRAMSLTEALDLDTDGLMTQAARIRLVQPSIALITSAAISVAAVLAWQAVPERSGAASIERDSFAVFPHRIEDWRQIGPSEILDPQVASTLGADDYYSATYGLPGGSDTVHFFTAWYADQSEGGVHSPEICLPSAGWEIAWLERTDVTERIGSETPFLINRAIIQKGQTRMMAYYYFDQKGRKIAWDFAAKFWLMIDGIKTGRTDGALIRLTTEIRSNESDADAEARLWKMLVAVQDPLVRFVPRAD